MYIKPIEKILGDSEKKFCVKKWGFYTILVLASSQDMLWKPPFLPQNFFSKFSRIFLLVRWACWRYLKGMLNLGHYDSKKIRNVLHIKQIISKEKSKNLDFWKFQCQNGVGELSRYAVKTSFFDLKLFFQSLLEFFYGSYIHIQGI